MPPPRGSKPVRNVVLVAIDTLRPDHLGCYGYAKATSPHIDALAARSMVFDHAIAPAIPTMPSFTTLLTGLHPYRHGIVSHIPPTARLDPRVETLPQAAQRAGFVTVGIDNLVAQGHGRGAWFARGFDFYSGYLYQPFTSQSAELVDRAIGYLDRFGDEPFLLYLHLWDPHTPYGPPPPYDTMHYVPGTGAYDLDDVKALSPEYYGAFLAEMRLQHPDDYADVVAQYDGEISCVDAQVGRLMAYLESSGRLDDTVVVLMSDHGECFGEGGIHFDHHGLVDATIRVALMVRTPDGAAGRCAGMVSTEDIFPTLAALCGWDLPTRVPLTGQSLVPALEGGPAPEREYLVAVESTRQASLALRTARWKLILPITHDLHGNLLPDLHGHARDPKPQLYDLDADPGEARDVGDSHPEVRAALLETLTQWRAREVAARGGRDPILESGLSLGYDEFMSRLRKRKAGGA